MFISLNMDAVNGCLGLLIMLSGSPCTGCHWRLCLAAGNTEAVGSGGDNTGLQLVLVELFKTWWIWPLSFFIIDILIGQAFGVSYAIFQQAGLPKVVCHRITNFHKAQLGMCQFLLWFINITSRIWFYQQTFVFIPAGSVSYGNPRWTIVKTHFESRNHPKNEKFVASLSDLNEERDK